MKKADIKQGKVYVGKLPETGCDEEDIKNHFSQYGAIAEVRLVFIYRVFKAICISGYKANRQV